MKVDSWKQTYLWQALNFMMPRWVLLSYRAGVSGFRPNPIPSCFHALTAVNLCSIMGALCPNACLQGKYFVLSSLSCRCDTVLCFSLLLITQNAWRDWLKSMLQDGEVFSCCCLPLLPPSTCLQFSRTHASIIADLCTKCLSSSSILN